MRITWYMEYRTLQEWLETFERKQMIFDSASYGKFSIANSAD